MSAQLPEVAGALSRGIHSSINDERANSKSNSEENFLVFLEHVLRHSSTPSIPSCSLSKGKHNAAYSAFQLPTIFRQHRINRQLRLKKRVWSRHELFRNYSDSLTLGRQYPVDQDAHQTHTPTSTPQPHT